VKTKQCDRLLQIVGWPETPPVSH